MSRSTPSTAVTPPNRFTTPSKRTAGCAASGSMSALMAPAGSDNTDPLFPGTGPILTGPALAGNTGGASDATRALERSGHRPPGAQTVPQAAGQRPDDPRALEDQG